ncbi:MAG: LysM peptidoglycan-binding domain-containing protein [Kofleriaceae bacterium]
MKRLVVGLLARLAIAAVVLAIAPRVAAAENEQSDIITIRAKQGDSLALLAAEFYGDRNKAIFIMVANKMDHPRPLKAGERIRIPVSRPYTTAPGDTFETIAANFLGDAKRGSFLAEFNGLSPDDRIPSGTDLFIPFTITHTAQNNESIAQIASAYFGNDKNAPMIRKYNFLGEKDTLEKGEKLTVPIFNVRLQASKLPPIDADSNKRREKQKKAQAHAASALPAARIAWRDGDFALVKDTLAGLGQDVDYLQTEQAVDVGVMLGAMHLAFGDDKPALEAFKRVLERKPTHVLSPYAYSPKVIAVWKEAGGGVTGEAP